MSTKGTRYLLPFAGRLLFSLGGDFGGSCFGDFWVAEIAMADWFQLIIQLI